MRDQYRAAPPAKARKLKGQPTAENKARREYFDQRNKAIQRGVKPPESGTFGKGVPDKK